MPAAEHELLRACRTRGLPEPRLQHRYIVAGKRRYTDAEFHSRSGRLIIVEVDGAAHMEVGQWHHDLRRQNELVATTGAIMLRVSSHQVRHQPETFFRRLHQALDL